MFYDKNEAFENMNSGILNDVIRGYLARTMRMSGYDNEQIANAINTLRYVLDSMNVDEAERYFMEEKWTK